MNLILRGLALVLAGASATTAAQAQAPAQQQQQQQAKSAEDSIKLSKKASKAVIGLQTAVNAKDVANIPAKLAAAEAVASTKEDHYWIARMQLKAAADAKDNAAAASALEAIAATGLMPANELASLYGALGNGAFDSKQYDVAAQAFEHQIALDPNNTTAMVNLAATHSAAGDKPETLSALQRAIKASAAAGKKLDENIYQRAVGMAYEAKAPDVIELSRDWVTAYPNPESWRNTIAIYRNQTHQDSEGTLDLLRLMQAAGAMQKPADYGIFVDADLDQQNYTEAQAVLDAGIAAKLVDPAGADFKQLAAEVKSKNKATAADLDAALKMSPKPINLLHIGDQFYALGDYAKAAEIYRQTMGKPGIDPDVANLHLGMALLQSGDKSGATAAFKGVTAARADIAKLWLIYAQQHA